MQKLRPRSPYEKLGGYVHLPRLIDKARLHRKGLLNGYNYKTVGFDKHLLAFLKLNPDAFEEAANDLDDDQAVLTWVQEHGVKHSPEAIEQWAATLPRDKPIVAYCIFGFQISGDAVAELRRRGFDARALKGGIGAWHAIGGPTVPLDQSTYEG